MVAILRKHICLMLLGQATGALHNITSNHAANLTRARNAGTVEAIIEALCKNARNLLMNTSSFIVLFALTNGNAEHTRHDPSGKRGRSQ
jgi:hypothetical protein